MVNAKIETVNPEVVNILYKRVRNGVKVLRKKIGPKWHDKINTKVLDMSDGQMCIVGQMFKKEIDHNYFRTDLLGEEVDINPPKFGFDIYKTYEPNLETEICVPDNDTQNFLYGVLGDIWRDVIRAEKKKNGKNV